MTIATQGRRVQRLSFNRLKDEDAERRVIAAIRFVSAVNGAPISNSLTIVPIAPPTGVAAPPETVPPVNVRRNRLGLYVIHTAPGFAAYCSQFDPNPISPPNFSRRLWLRVTDPSLQYFPSEFSVPLPRSLDSTRVLNEFMLESTFRPYDERLLPSPTALVASGWAQVRVLVWREEDDPASPGTVRRVPVPAALVWVRQPNAPKPLGKSFTEWRLFKGEQPRSAAEALVPISGIPTTMWSDQPDAAVMTDTIRVQVEVRYDKVFTAQCERVNWNDPQRKPTDPPSPEGSPPLLQRLEPGNAPFTQDVIVGKPPPPEDPSLSPDTFPLRAGARKTVHAVFDKNNQFHFET